MKSIRSLCAGTLLAAAPLLAATLPLAAASAQDNPAPASAPGPHGWGPARIFSKLGLTAAQQQSVQSMLAAAGPGLKSLHQQMRANSLELKQIKPDDPNYANVVAQVSQSNGALHSQMITQQANLRAQLYGVLTNAQKTLLAQLEAQWKASPHHHRHWGGAPPPPPPAT